MLDVRRERKESGIRRLDARHPTGRGLAHQAAAHPRRADRASPCSRCSRSSGCSARRSDPATTCSTRPWTSSPRAPPWTRSTMSCSTRACRTGSSTAWSSRSGPPLIGLILAATSAYAFSRYKFRVARPGPDVPVRDPAHPGHHAAGADLPARGQPRPHRHVPGPRHRLRGDRGAIQHLDPQGLLRHGARRPGGGGPHRWLLGVPGVLQDPAAAVPAGARHRVPVQLPGRLGRVLHGAA